MDVMFDNKKAGRKDVKSPLHGLCCYRIRYTYKFALLHSCFPLMQIMFIHCRPQ